MKITLDLPDDLVREIKIESARTGEKLKDLVAELLRRELDAPRNQNVVAARLTVNSRTGLPAVAGTVQSSPRDEMTPARVAELLQRQEEEWLSAAGR